MSPLWPLAEQLNFVHRNMLPRLQIAIRRTEFFVGLFDIGIFSYASRAEFSG